MFTASLPRSSLPADVLWGSFVTHSFLPHGFISPPTKGGTKYELPQKRQLGSSLRKHQFLLALCRWGRFARNVPSGEVRGETDVFAG